MYYRRKPNDLDSLLRWRRNVFLQAPGRGYVLVSASRAYLSLYRFNRSFRADHVERLQIDMPDGLWDGQAWCLPLLNDLITELVERHEVVTSTAASED